MYQCILTKARCKGARFQDADLTYADFSYADVSAVSFAGTKLFRANLHGIRDEKAYFTGNKAVALGLDPDRAEAETWRSPY